MGLIGNLSVQEIEVLKATLENIKAERDLCLYWLLKGLQQQIAAATTQCIDLSVGRDTLIVLGNLGADPGTELGADMLARQRVYTVAEVRERWGKP